MFYLRLILCILFAILCGCELEHKSSKNSFNDTEVSGGNISVTPIKFEESDVDQRSETCQESPQRPCLQCNELGELEAKETAEACINVSCEGLTRFELVTNERNESICMVSLFETKDTLCTSAGDCLVYPDYCRVRDSYSYFEMALDSACVEMIGCTGTIPPQLVINEGNSCNNGEGICSETGECAQRGIACPVPSYDEAILCTESLASCYYVTDIGFSGLIVPVDCDQFCEELNGSCLGTFDLSNHQIMDPNICTLEGNRRPCDYSRFSLVKCECEF